MDENTELTVYIKRFLYATLAELWVAAGLTLAYGASLAYFGKVVVAVGLGFFALPIAAFTSFFDGISWVAWYVIILQWILILMVRAKTDPRS